jgi:tetratricopeptide (TPR) repeat protein
VLLLPAVLLSSTLTLASAGQAAKLPPLPDLPLSTLPSAARDAMSRAHKEAAARPLDATVVGALARLLHAWELWESAHQAYTRAQALAPQAFEWPYLDAFVLQRLARHAEAAERLRRAVAADPTYLPARLKLAEALLDAGDLAESRQAFEPLLKEPAALPAAHVGLGRIAAAEGRHAEAIRHFEEAIALFPELGAAYYAVARSYRATGREADAERAFQQHQRFGPRWPGIDDPVLGAVRALRDDARAILAKGIASAQAGDAAAAIAAHEAALQRDPSLVHVHANLLSLYGQAGNWAKAEEHYRAAIKAGFTPADLHYDYGVVLGLQQQWDAAEAAYRRALEANPLHANARNNLGQLLERKRDFEGAASEYRQATEAQPSFRLARFNLGRMLLQLKRGQQAIEQFERLQEPRDAETPRYLFALATAHVMAGHRDEGLKLAISARNAALEFGQTDLAAAIDRQLASLK